MKFIKNNLSKILICLSLCLTLLFTLCFNAKTYAYSDSNSEINWNWQELTDFKVQLKFDGARIEINENNSIDDSMENSNYFDFSVGDIYVDYSDFVNGIDTSFLFLNRFLSYDEGFIKIYYDSTISRFTNGYLKIVSYSK